VFYDEFVSLLKKSAPANLQWKSQVYLSKNHTSLASNAFNDAITAVFSSQRPAA